MLAVTGLGPGSAVRAARKRPMPAASVLPPFGPYPYRGKVYVRRLPNKAGRLVRAAQLIPRHRQTRVSEAEDIMKETMRFGEVLEAISKLSLEEQETLMSILERRIAEQGRKMLAAEIQEARREFAEGRSRPVAADELMKEILS